VKFALIERSFFDIQNDRSDASDSCDLGRVGPTSWTALFEVGADEVDEVLGYFLRGERGATGLQHVLADVVFEDLGHEAVDTAADVGEEHEDVGAVGVAAEGALDGVDLTADTFDAGEEFFVLTMSHLCCLVICLYLSFTSLYILGGYGRKRWISKYRPINLRNNGDGAAAGRGTEGF
jgi:hypothetical protein